MDFYKEIAKESYTSYWLIFLYLQEYCVKNPDNYKRNGITKSQMERDILLIPPNNTFRRLCEEMISDGIIVNVGNKLINGNIHEVFLIDRNKLFEQIRQLKLYQLFVRYYLDYDVLFNPQSMSEQRNIFKLIKQGDL